MTTAGTIHKGAGILFLTKERKALFLKRGPGGDCPGMWCFPGGTVEEGETVEQTAAREAKEELGNFPKGELEFHSRTTLPVQSTIGQPQATLGEDVVDFTTFLQRVGEEFHPTLNGEHTGWAWADIGQPPEPLHPGCRLAIERFGWNELDVARAMRDGLVPSPQRYAMGSGGVTLFDLRITGTGVAYRSEKTDAGGKVISPEEFVFRRPENYLTPEFVERCNGLQVIYLHPKKTMLNSKEFAERTVGSMMLPYIKGDEVWGIAKIYDDAVIKMMTSRQMSTSPGVILKDGNYKLKTEDGTDLLIEGKPSLLDHLAICEQGVWDKGGEPSGVRLDAQGDTEMPFTEEDKKVLGGMIAEIVQGTLKTALGDTTSLVRMDDAGSKRIDSVLSAMDAMCGKMDDVTKRMDAHTARMDAAEAKEKEGAPEKVAADKKDGDDDKDKDKKDAEEEEAKAKEAKDKKDAEEKEKAEKEKADAAEKLARSAVDRIAAVEKAMPKQLTDAERHDFSKAQARADEVFSAFGKKAPYPLNGEDLLPYRRRMANDLKAHSRAWKDVDVLAINDAATFQIAEDTIFREAAQAALRPTDLRHGELRELVRQDSTTGIRTVEFVGNQSFVAAMTRPPRYVKSINVGRRADA